MVEKRLENIMDVCGLIAKICLKVVPKQPCGVDHCVYWSSAGIDLNCHATMTAIFISTESGGTTHLVKPNVDI